MSSDAARAVPAGRRPGQALCRRRRAGVRRASTSRIAQASSSASSATRGCGKTTILNVLAGLDSASAGHVFMDGREVAGPSLERGVVFQGHALMPWLTRAQQHRLRGAQQVARLDAARRSTTQVEKYVDMVGLSARDRQEAVAAVGRHEAARRHRARLRDPAEDAAARRAVRRARRADARHDPGRAAAHLRRDAPDGVHDHARRRRGDPARRPHPADEQRPAGARRRDRAQHDAARARSAPRLHHDPQYYRIRNHLVDFLVVALAPSCRTAARRRSRSRCARGCEADRRPPTPADSPSRCRALA